MKKSSASNRLTALQKLIRRHRTALVAFSGGVDSTFLARVARDVLGANNVILSTVVSALTPSDELKESSELADMLGLYRIVIPVDERQIPGIAENAPNRCYACKREVFSALVKVAEHESRDAVFDGTNADDVHDYRPGRRALEELGIVSPLREVGMKKAEIREHSRRLELPTADKPSLACLASRFPYGEPITRERLKRVDTAERSIRALGFAQLRVRSHGDLARVELPLADLDSGWSQRGRIEAACKDAGFTYVALDTRGYRTGAMNEVLDLSAASRQATSFVDKQPRPEHEVRKL